MKNVYFDNTRLWIKSFVQDKKSAECGDVIILLSITPTFNEQHMSRDVSCAKTENTFECFHNFLC
jgi:hypothetical protein